MPKKQVSNARKTIPKAAKKTAKKVSKKIPKKQVKPKARRTRVPGKESCQTLKQASASTGLSIPVIKRCRDKFAAPCFRSGRIYIEELKEWVKANESKLKDIDPNSKESLEAKQLRLKCEKIEIDLAKSRGELIPATAVMEAVMLLSSEIVKIHKSNENNYSPMLAMLEVDQVRVHMRRITDDVSAKMSAILDPWAKKWNQ